MISTRKLVKMTILLWWFYFHSCHYFRLATSCWANKITRKIFFVKFSYLLEDDRDILASSNSLKKQPKNTWMFLHQVYFKVLNRKFHIILKDFKSISAAVKLLSHCQKMLYSDLIYTFWIFVQKSQNHRFCIRNCTSSWFHCFFRY